MNREIWIERWEGVKTYKGFWSTEEVVAILTRLSDVKTLCDVYTNFNSLPFSVMWRKNERL